MNKRKTKVNDSPIRIPGEFQNFLSFHNSLTDLAKKVLVKARKQESDKLKQGYKWVKLENGVRVLRKESDPESIT